MKKIISIFSLIMGLGGLPLVAMADICPGNYGGFCGPTIPGPNGPICPGNYGGFCGPIIRQ